MAFSVKAGLAVLLMGEAWRLSSMCQAIEDEEKHLDWQQPHSQDNLGHAAAAVMLAAAALEASVNEMYLRAVDRHFSAFPELEEAQVKLLAELWEVVEGARSNPLKKHDVALAAVEKTPLTDATDPGQSASSLFKLRDLLVHFKPEWEHELDQHRKLEHRLEGKFQPNQLSAAASGRMLWFPGHCLGAGCANWACETAVAYHKEFGSRLGIRQILAEP